MRIRKNVRNLSAQERKEYVDALLAVKEDGLYDRLVQYHVDSMANTTPHVGDDFRPARNAAHRGPAFLPWHREFLLMLEQALQDKNANVSIPYWDWTQDSADPFSSPIWSEDFMGGNGVEEHGWRVMDGPFAYDKGVWRLRVDTENGGEALRRRFGRLEFQNPNGSIDEIDYTIPTEEDLELAKNERHYGAYPYNDSSYSTGFRNRIEGWITQRADPQVKTLGSQLHNRVHVYVAGAWVEIDEQGNKINVSGTMLLGSSPNDPVFFLHHCFIDKVWADWQRQRREVDPDGIPHYAPISGGPTGHNLNDPMYPWGGTRTPAALLDITSLGYKYDTYEDIGRLPELAEERAIGAYGIA